ncbi:hypothetical protein [Clostridium sp. KNHs214]|uniref:hypothetical protein n=1 Tax=Clostridium sp. KNHs214 TaxID=1540257 RepID=UPI000554E6D7|nr:hypothetical protein [Clostridium sp. KNHs214]
MIGKIIDMNKTDAFINFQDGTTMDISVTRLPKNSKIGDTVDIAMNSSLSSSSTSNKVIDFFI